MRSGNKNKLTLSHQQKILDAFIARKDIDHFARLMNNGDIAENGYNIAVSSYVEQRDTSEVVDIKALNVEIACSLTDIAKYRNADDPRFVIQNWMRTRFTVEFLGIWEQLNNPDFNRVEFEAVKNESGSNAFVMTPTKWASLTGVRKLEEKKP